MPAPDKSSFSKNSALLPHNRPMMKIHEAIQLLETLAPPALQENYDNACLICGDPQTEVRGALCTLDCTEAVIDEALRKGCNLIIAHHPIVFGGLKSLTGKTYIERTVIKAIKNDIAIYAMHTNLDHVWNGVNRRIGEKLGLENLEILTPKEGLLLKLHTFVPTAHLEAVKTALFEAGAGHIGEYDHCSFSSEGTGTFRASAAANPHVGEAEKDHAEAETRLEMVLPVYAKTQVIAALKRAHPYEEAAYDLVELKNPHGRIGSGMTGTLPTTMSERDFLTHIAQRMECATIRHTALLGREVGRVAFCGGAGRFLLPVAIARQADFFVTADFKYHDFFDAENKIVVADIGHFESEQFTPNLIADFLHDKNATFAVLLSEVKTNPVHYFIP